MNSNTREYEVRFLNIDISYVTKKLINSGYKLKNERFLQKRYVYDVDKKEQSWLRLLEKESGNTLAYKNVLSSDIDGTEEIEVTVSSFKDTKLVLEKIGFKPKGYQENYRTLFIKGDIEATIDEWPKLKPYLEIEGNNKNKVLKAIKHLELKYDYTTKDNHSIYKECGIDLDNTPILKFD